MGTGYLLACVTILVWGLVVIPVKATRTSGHLGIAISMPVGVIGLLIAAMVLNTPLPKLGDLISSRGLLLVLSGVFQFPLGTMFYYEAIRCADVSEAVPVTRLKTVFVVALAALLAIDRVSLRLVIACLLGIAGAFILVRRTVPQENRARRPKMCAPTNGPIICAHPLTRGILFALLAAASWALGDVFIRLVLDTVSPAAATLLSLACGAAVYLAILALKGLLPQVVRMPRRDKLLYAAHGILSFGIGYSAFYAAIQDIGVVSASILTSTWPAVSFIVGLALYREPLSVRKVVGFALLMGSGLMLISPR